MLKLRLSDTCSHAEEFQADSQSTFSLGLYEALQRYNSHFGGRGPRPHLHVWTNATETRGRWIDAGYGRGTHIVLRTDMMENTAYLTETWERCQQALANSLKFSEGLRGLTDFIAGAVKDDEDRA